MTGKIETVEVTLKIPKQIIEFYEAWLKFLGSKSKGTEYLKADLEDHVKSLTGQIIAEACNSMFYDGRKDVIEKYSLAPFLDLADVGLDLKDLVT